MGVQPASHVQGELSAGVSIAGSPGTTGRHAARFPDRSRCIRRSPRKATVAARRRLQARIPLPSRPDQKPRVHNKAIGRRRMCGTTSAVEQSATRKVFWRIVPYCFTLYVISYLDRANIGYAALQMNKDLALSSEAFGFAAGIFFIGYFLFEVPSNVALNKFGPRVWISRILVTWGVIATATAF